MAIVENYCGYHYSKLFAQKKIDGNHNWKRNSTKETQMDKKKGKKNQFLYYLKSESVLIVLHARIGWHCNVAPYLARKNAAADKTVNSSVFWLKYQAMACKVNCSCICGKMLVDAMTGALS